MSIIDDYNELANKIVAEDETIKRYEEELRCKKATITSLLNGRSLSVLLHPIRLIRLSKEKKRLIRISDTLDELKRSTILNNMDEESGELEEDLYNSAHYFKPNRIKWFMKEHSVYDESIEKKLRLIKK